MMRRLRTESGQVIVAMLIFMSALGGGVALTVDVGSWYREHRQAQLTADAAALAGAQSLPAAPAIALNTAQTYADKNGGGVIANGITFRSDFEPNDTVVVKINRTAPGFFSKLFGIDSAKVKANAIARSAVPINVRWAAPIVVDKSHPKLTGTPGCPCFGDNTEIPLGKNGAPGSFSLIDFEKFLPPGPSGQCDRSSGGGNAGSNVLADWILNGFDDWLNLGCYASDPGAKFASSDITAALNARIGSDLLFPVYDALTGQGSNAQYRIVGWAAFHLTGFDSHGNEGSVAGYFTQVIWDGIQSSTAPSGPDYGVHSIALIN